MSQSPIQVGEHGFWVADGLLCPWLRMLALNLREPMRDDSAETVSLIKSVRDRFLFVSKGYCMGWAPIKLEETFATPEGKEVVRAAIITLLDFLSRAPETLPRNALDLWGFDEASTPGYDIKTAWLIEVGKAFLVLMEDRPVEETEHIKRLGHKFRKGNETENGR
jgi:hypothetical protein